MFKIIEHSSEKLSKKEQKTKLKNLQENLQKLQQEMTKAKLPVVVLFEGFSAAGKGEMISKLISELDPRSYKVYSTSAILDTEKRFPFLFPFWEKIPLNGNMSIFDRSWYYRCSSDCDEFSQIKEENIDSINIFERQLSDDGYLVLKFFLHIGKKEQKRRLKNLQDDSSTSWRVTSRDLRMNKEFDKKHELYSNLIEKTSVHANWNVIDNEDDKLGAIDILEIIKNSIENAIEHGIKEQSKPQVQNFPLISMPKLSEYNLSHKVSDKEYKEQLKIEKEKIRKLHSALYREKTPVILAFEGWDAAGKGGAIRRLSWALDPRGFKVIPVAAPSPDELHRHYLWRFWKNLEKDGHFSIFDRTWYGRVLVERIESFAKENRWQEAYAEMNEFEKELSKWGAIVIKFWLQIDKNTQLERFELRKETPEKQYKITEEDWRNREKWEQYETAVNDMLQKTSTIYAPWVVVEANDKKYARLKVLKTVREALEKRL
ncbi:MAG: phosphate--AMP phosphotransferase [Clostridia bacterium]